MYAVIETGGKQYRVQPGDTLRVETLPGVNGTELQLGSVVAVFDGETVKTGSDIGQAHVKATIAGQGRGPKVIVFKFKRKKQYKRTIGHRQNYTEVKIADIVL